MSKHRTIFSHALTWTPLKVAPESMFLRSKRLGIFFFFALKKKQLLPYWGEWWAQSKTMNLHSFFSFWRSPSQILFCQLPGIPIPALELHQPISTFPTHVQLRGGIKRQLFPGLALEAAPGRGRSRDSVIRNLLQHWLVLGGRAEPGLRPLRVTVLDPRHSRSQL